MLFRSFGGGGVAGQQAPGLRCLLLVLKHLWVLDDGGSQLGLCGNGQTLPIDVRVDGVLEGEESDRKEIQ